MKRDLNVPGDASAGGSASRNASRAADGAGADAEAPAMLRGTRLGYRILEVKHLLEKACAKVDAAREFADDPIGHEEARVLRKLAAYRSWLVDHGLLPDLNWSRPWSKRILERIGHAGYVPTPAVAAEIAGLADLLPADGSGTAAMKPTRMTRLADDYIRKMLKRKRGLPRSRHFKIDWRAAAVDMGCGGEEIPKSVKVHLRAVDAKIDAPDGTVGRYIRKATSKKANPAVAGLLAAELARRAGALPADPMCPSSIDLVELAFGAGVSVRDLTETKDAPAHLATIEAALQNATLAPHPLVAERRFTFSELKEFGRKRRAAEAERNKVVDFNAAARITVSAMTQFMRMPRLGGSATDLAPLDLPDRIRRAVASKPAGVDSGWAAQMQRWIGYFDELRSTKPLPENWTSALRLLAAEAGVTFRQMVDEVGGTVQFWLSGQTFPSHQNQPAVTKLERLLRVTGGTLTDRLTSEWRRHLPAVSIAKLGKHGIGKTLPTSIAELSPEDQEQMILDHALEFKVQNTEYTRRLAEQVNARYRLKFAKWPQAMQDAWETQTPDETAGDGRKPITGREPGQRPSKEERSHRKSKEERSWRTATGTISKGLMESFFGYLVRSSETPAASKKKNDNGFVDGPGLGMPIDLVHPALFAVVDLMAGYKHWRKDRSGGLFGPHIAYTMRQAAEYLKPKSGLVWKNPGFIAQLERFSRWWDDSGARLGIGTLVLDLEAFREDWHGAVEEAWEILQEDATELRPKDPNRQKIRDPFEAINGYIANPDDDPMAKYMIGVRQMLKSRPLTALDVHLHRRNAILTLILVQTGLRAGTLLLTVSGPDPTLRREVAEDGAVSWRIEIPAAKFKNFYSPYFDRGRPFEFRLDDEDDLYPRLDEYMLKSRPYLLAGRTSDALFVTKTTRDADATELSRTFRAMTGVFFVWREATKTGVKGVRPHGLHAVRHVIATSLLRTTGDIYLAAWAIQDTATTVERHYGRFLPRDKVRLAVEHLRKSRVPPAPRRSKVAANDADVREAA